MPIQGLEKKPSSVTTFYEAVALSFVIPSEAEGSVVRLYTLSNSSAEPVAPTA